ncbi:MAG: carbamoyltransferase HypF [Acidobacteriia bacterium]|nr:carbamoyltransferase HypF [Terriglobia bacterium]
MKERLQVIIRGAVQGVGFRPFIYRLATDLRLAGGVSNSAQGVFIEAEGERSALESFLLRIEKDKPPLASIQSLEFSYLDLLGFSEFRIRASAQEGAKQALILPDIATCDECRREIFDPSNRRYRYPFTNCTQCGPRFTLIESLPYDRENTSMKRFRMCEQCRREYDDPHDRRFHAQPNACTLCGPHLEFWGARGEPLSSHHQALESAVQAIREGRIVALKGLGGFQLLTDACNHEAIERLRRRKHREEKPLALMFPDLASILELCTVSPLEQRLLQSPESPIVLLKRKTSDPRSTKYPVAPSVAPRNPYFGVMLPYTPLHHLLMHEVQFPIVATSGNLSDEPLCIDEQEAVHRLHDIADFFLIHDRPIVRHADDSVVRVVLERELVLRRSRGYAPLPVRILSETSKEHASDGPRNNDSEPRTPILAVGGHLKNTVAVTSGDGNVFLSQHIGDLETAESLETFQTVVSDLQRLYGISAERIASDPHPDYLSTQFAKKNTSQPLAVQHHFAHVAACMAENQIEGPVLGVAWDGTGWGQDGTIWGGEFLLVENGGFRRVGSLRPFRLPGGTAAIKEPRRTAFGLLWEIFHEDVLKHEHLVPIGSFSPPDRHLIGQMLSQNVNCPVTTSAGRLFDAVASLLDVRQRISFEGQAAMDLEFRVDEKEPANAYPFRFLDPQHGGSISRPPHRAADSDALPEYWLDWEPMIKNILKEIPHATVEAVAARFHQTLAEMIVAAAQRAKRPRVVLSGGCFQNRVLMEQAVGRLRAEGFQPYWHQRVPPNDGGIALGQMAVALHQIRKEKLVCV